MWGARARENIRQAVRRRERSAANANEHVKRAFATMCTKRKMVPQIHEELEQVQKRMKLCRGPSSIREFLNLKAEAERLQKSIDEIESGVEAQGFFERARPLLLQADNEPEHTLVDVNMEQKREALAMSLFHAEKAVPVYVQKDRCTACNQNLVIRSEESLLVCPNPACKNTFNLVQLSTDHIDTDQLGQDSNANHTRSTCTGGIDGQTHSDDGFANPALYKKFLMQFSPKVADPPDEVLEIIARELSKVHIHHGTKVQPTPIGNILRKQNLKEWVWMSMRISILLKKKVHEPMPAFTDALIDRMIRRFENLLDALKRSKCRNRKKVFNFKFITKVFLVMDGDYALSELFENHKTRAVLRRENKRVGEGCQILESEMQENGFTWKFFRSL